MNPKGNNNNANLVALIDAHPSAAMNVKLLPPPPPHMEDVPLPPPLLLVPPPQETNEILTNSVNLHQQQNNRLEHMEKNQENIQRNKHHETLDAVDNTAYIPANHRKGGKKPPNDSNKGSSSQSPRHSRRGKPFDRHGGKNSPPRQSRQKKEDYSLGCHYKNYRKGTFTRKVAEYFIPPVFVKHPNIET